MKKLATSFALLLALPTLASAGTSRMNVYPRRYTVAPATGWPSGSTTRTLTRSGVSAGR